MAGMSRPVAARARRSSLEGDAAPVDASVEVGEDGGEVGGAEVGGDGVEVWGLAARWRMVSTRCAAVAERR